MLEGKKGTQGGGGETNVFRRGGNSAVQAARKTTGSSCRGGKKGDMAAGAQEGEKGVSLCAQKIPYGGRGKRDDGKRGGK